MARLPFLGASLLAFAVACGGGASSAPSTRLRFVDPYGAPAVPQWMALQDGDGPWEVVPPSAERVIQIRDSAGRYGVAYTNDTGGSAVSTRIILTTRSETPDPRLPLFQLPPAPASAFAALRGQISGLASSPDAAPLVQVILAGPDPNPFHSEALYLDADGPYAQSFLRAGTYTAFPLLTGAAPPDQPPSLPTRFLPPTPVDLAAGGTALLDMDFAARGEAPRALDLRLEDPLGAGDRPSALLWVRVGGNGFLAGVEDPGDPTRLRSAIPPASWGNAPVYAYTVTAGSRGIVGCFTSPQARTLFLPDRTLAPAALALDPLGAPTQLAWTPDPHWQWYLLNSYSFAASGEASWWSLWWSQGRAGSGSMALPSLDTLPGRLSAWDWNAHANEEPLHVSLTALRGLEGESPLNAWSLDLTRSYLVQYAGAEVYFDLPGIRAAKDLGLTLFPWPSAPSSPPTSTPSRPMPGSAPAWRRGPSPLPRP